MEEFNEYYTRTEAKRTLENVRANTYISARREISREKYILNNTQFTANNKIEAENILFSSSYAPLVVAELTADEIKKVAQQSQTIFIDLYLNPKEELPPPSDLGIIKDTTRINEVHNILDLRGRGVKIGMMDHGTYQTSSELPSNRFTILGTPHYHDHADNCAKIVAGTNGVAPGAHVYIHYDGMSETSFMISVEALISAGVSVITCSRTQGTYSSPISTYPTIAAWTDHVVSTHNVTFLAAVGNGPSWIESNQYNVIAPANADNVISVTGYNNMETAETTDDIMYDFCYNNGNQAFKPDITVPANILGGGTSSATPYAAGVVALMMELRPSLKIYPEAVKAILMASCHHKANPYPGNPTEYMSSGLTTRQGAGVINAYRAIAITGQGNYGVRYISGGSGVKQTISFRQPPYGASGLNVSLSWLKQTSFSGSNHEYDSFTGGIRWDLDLYLKQGSTTLKASTKATSSTEMVYVTPSSSNSDYTIEILKYSSTTGTIRYGYAWSVSTDRYQYTSEFEGIYFLKNKSSGYYLNLNTGTLQTSQTDYSGTNVQQWILRDVGNYYYQIQSAYNSVGKLVLGNLLSSGNYKASVASTGSGNMDVWRNSDGSFTFVQLLNGSIYALGIYEGSTTSGATAVWSSYSASNEHQKWYLEKLSYQKGDVNLNGNITTSDAQTVLSYTTGSSSLNTIQLFLADVNGDGVITTTDSTLILQMAVGKI